MSKQSRIGHLIYNFRLMVVIFSVFLAGLMAGRPPEYLGKKIEASRSRCLHRRPDAARGGPAGSGSRS